MCYAQCCHGDGMKYHGHLHSTIRLQCWQKLSLPEAICVDGKCIATSMVVVGHICTQNIMVVHKLPEAICVAMATCNLLGKILHVHNMYSFSLREAHVSPL